MGSKKSFMENDEGVHLMHPEEEGTLCGMFWDESNGLEDTKKKVVTCKICCRMLKFFKTVKFRSKS